MLGLLIGSATGVIVASWSVAQRIESAYDVLIDEVDPPDFLSFGADGPRGTPIVDDPAVRAVAAITQLYPVLRTVDGTLLGPLTGECDTSAGELATVTIDAAVVGVPSRVIEGRLPAAGAADEIAIATTTAGRAGVHVGDTVYLHGTCHNDEPPIDPPLPLRVVGEIVGFLDVRTAGQDLYFENVVVTRALLDDLDRVTEDIIGVWLRDGSSAADLVSETGDAAPTSFFFATSDHAAQSMRVCVPTRRPCGSSRSASAWPESRSSSNSSPDTCDSLPQITVFSERLAWAAGICGESPCSTPR